MVDASTKPGRASLRALIADAMRHITMGVVVPPPFDEGPQDVTFEVEEAGQPPRIRRKRPVTHRTSLSRRIHAQRIKKLS